MTCNFFASVIYRSFYEKELYIYVENVSDFILNIDADGLFKSLDILTKFCFYDKD